MLEIHIFGGTVGADKRSLRTYVILDKLPNLSVPWTPHNKHDNAYVIGLGHRVILVRLLQRQDP